MEWHRTNLPCQRRSHGVACKAVPFHTCASADVSLCIKICGLYVWLRNWRSMQVNPHLNTCIRSPFSTGTWAYTEIRFSIAWWNINRLSKHMISAKIKWTWQLTTKKWMENKIQQFCKISQNKTSLNKYNHLDINKPTWRKIWHLYHRIIPLCSTQKHARACSSFTLDTLIT